MSESVNDLKVSSRLTTNDVVLHIICVCDYAWFVCMVYGMLNIFVFLAKHPILLRSQLSRENKSKILVAPHSTGKALFLFNLDAIQMESFFSLKPFSMMVICWSVLRWNFEFQISYFRLKSEDGTLNGRPVDKISYSHSLSGKQKRTRRRIDSSFFWISGVCVNSGWHSHKWNEKKN